MGKGKYPLNKWRSDKKESPLTGAKRLSSLPPLFGAGKEERIWILFNYHNLRN
jgi:hypothetical protein